jgi:hypothetical protein
MVKVRQIAVLACMTALGLSLASCGSEPPPAPAVSSISPDALVGSWGLASYHDDKDRARTEKEARSQCNKPYVIARGPNGGLVMHLADQAQPQELVLKAGQGGQTYLGPAGDPGGADDRIVSRVDDKSFTVNWVDPETAGRYGTMVYVRCPAK